MADESFDAVIVGARVAGATVAALLGDMGHRVLLVDRASFPSPTLSTHFFRGAYAVSVLERLGILDTVLATGCPPLTCQYDYLDGSPVGDVNPPQQPGEIGYALSVRRETLDTILVQRAVANGNVTLMEKTRLRDLTHEDNRVTSTQFTTADGTRDIRARIVIGADGRHSTVAKLVNAAAEIWDAATRPVYYCYVRGFSGPDGSKPDGPEFSLLGNEIAYVLPSDDSVTCLAISIDRDDYAAFRADPERHFRERMYAHRAFTERYEQATMIGRLLACGPEPNWMRVPVGPGWALVGDAGQHQDPWSGHGIDNAMVHATYLAEAIDDWLRGRTSVQAALQGYHRRRNELSTENYHSTLEFARAATAVETRGATAP